MKSFEPARHALSLQTASSKIAGGVVSMNRKVQPTISFVAGRGAYLTAIDGREFLDYHAAFAPHLLGHNHPDINAAVRDAMDKDWSLFGSGPAIWEGELAALICQALPGLERIQITNTGSEATAHAIRLSRAWTGREDIILTLGGYNGWHNEVARAVMPSLAEVGPRVSPGEYPLIPSSSGIPESTRRRLHVVNFNDLDSVEYVMRRYPVACVLTEPVLQNVGVILPRPGYLEELQSLCRRYGALFVLDEVKTGFRCAAGGYQTLAQLQPDLSTFGKAIANGYPLGVIAGRGEIMDLFCHPDPARRVLIAGTYNAHPFTSAAAIATIRLLLEGEVYPRLEELGARLQIGLEAALKTHGVTATVCRLASAFCIYFMDHAPCDWHDVAQNHDFQFDVAFRRALIERGIYFFPAACKQSSISAAHVPEDIDRTIDAVGDVLHRMRTESK